MNPFSKIILGIRDFIEISGKFIFIGYTVEIHLQRNSSFEAVRHLGTKNKNFG